MLRDKIKAPDYDILARAYLGRGLAKHPDAARHVTNVADIEDMGMLKLMSLARKMGVDPDAIIEAVEKEQDRQRRYSNEFPGFKGRIEFDLTVEVFGKRVPRKARAEYEFTPEWEYFDLHKKAPYVGWSGCSMSLEFVNVPEQDGALGDPTWQEVGGILNIGEVWNHVEDAIEEQCRVEDAERRRVAAQSAESPARRTRARH